MARPFLQAEHYILLGTKRAGLVMVKTSPNSRVKPPEKYRRDAARGDGKPSMNTEPPVLKQLIGLEKLFGRQLLHDGPHIRQILQI